MAEKSQNNLNTLIGRFIVDQGLATAEEVHDCQEFQRELLSHDPSANHRRDLSELLVANGVITQRQLDRVRSQILEHTVEQNIPGFNIIEKLGAGAMATVYQAKQLSLDRLVAIKVLPRQYTDNPQFVQRFYAEGRAAAKLNHPNIVGALDVGKAGDFHYIVMEYVEGRTVFDDLTQLERYGETEALHIVIQITRALDHAHKAGLIHRDVKPKNIIITSNGVAKLADMGLVRTQHDHEAAQLEQGKAFGTPYYISPEQIRGVLDIDFRADIYGLGATFYHMVTGKVPFEGSSPSTVMQKHLKEIIVPPDHINPNLSAGVGEIIEVCMAKDRDQRYASTASLLEDLTSVAQGNPPLVARRKFDVAVLSTLVEPPGALNTLLASSKRAHLKTLMTKHPWTVILLAVTGWIIAAVLVMLLLTKQAPA